MKTREQTIERVWNRETGALISSTDVNDFEREKALKFYIEKMDDMKYIIKFIKEVKENDRTSN